MVNDDIEAIDAFDGAAISLGGGGSNDCVAVMEMLSGSLIGNIFAVGDSTGDDEGVDLFFTPAKVVSKCRVTLTVLPDGNLAAQAAMSADGSPVAALNSAIVLSGKTPSLTV